MILGIHPPKSGKAYFYLYKLEKYFMEFGQRIYSTLNLIG